MPHKPIDQIATEDLLSALQPIWQKKPETASRLRERIEAILGQGIRLATLAAPSHSSAKGIEVTCRVLAAAVGPRFNDVRVLEGVAAYVEQLRQPQWHERFLPGVNAFPAVLYKVDLPVALPNRK